MNSPPTHPRGRLAATAVWLAAGWVAAGALFKLFSGSPNDLPASIQELLFDPVTTFRLAIAIELCIVLAAIFRPRLGWIPLVLLFLVFDAVLLPLVAQGADSCGCFGSRVPITPAMMMTIDTVLLVGILVTRPWSALAGWRLSPLPLVPLFALAIAAPWYVFRTGGAPARPKAGQVAQATSSQGESDAPIDDGNGSDAVGSDTNLPPDTPVTGLPDFHLLNPETWIGQEILQVEELQGFLEVELLPPDCEVVFYRQQCDHCKQHLEELAMQPASPEDMRVLVRIPDPGDEPENELTVIKPEALLTLELVELERGYGGLKTPADMRLTEWTVQAYQEIEHE